MSPEKLTLMKLLAACLLAAWVAGSSDCGAGEIQFERIFGPEVPTGPYKHPACFDELANGDLYLVFFSGQGEYGDAHASVWASRLKKDAKKWTKPVIIASNPFHSLGNAVVWQAPDGVVWLFYVSRYGETWSDSRITAKISRDGAQTWSESFMLTFQPGTMVRGHPIVLSNGDYLLPAYHETGHDPENVGADTTSFFLRFNPAQKQWMETGHIRSLKGNLQPSPAAIIDSHLMAFCRRGGNYEPTTNGWLIRAESLDGGQTWSEGRDSHIRNPNAAVDLLKLRNGHLLLVFNDSMNDRTPLTAAISTDGGKTFLRRRNLIDDPKGDFGYPTAIQTHDGQIQVLFTSDERSVVRRAIFAEEDITEPGRR
jgi:predicted neuraminidase